MRPISVGGAGAGGYLDWQYPRQVGTAVWERWYCGSLSVMGGLVTPVPVVDRLYAIPFLEPRGGTLDRIGMVLSGGAAAGNMRLGIYQATSTTNLYPGALVLDAGAFSTAAPTGLKSLVIAQALSPNTLYWLACLTDTNNGGAMNYYGWHSSTAIPYLGWSTTSGTGYSFVYVAQAYGALPNPFPAGATIAAAVDRFAIGVRYSA